MEFNPINNKSIPLTDGNLAKKQVSENTSACDSEISYENLSSADAGLLRAYVGLEMKTVPKERFFDYLREAGIKNESLFESVADAVSDENGIISQQAFAFVKSFLEKNQSIFSIQEIFKQAKNNDVINFKVLKVIDGLIVKNNANFVSSRIDYKRILIEMKDKTQEFNNDLLELVLNNQEEFKKLVNLNTSISSRLFVPLKNKEGMFDKNAIKFALSQTAKGKSYAEIISVINKSKDENGNFSATLMQDNAKIEELFKGNNLIQVKKTLRTLPKDNDKIKEDFLKFVSELKNDESFCEIIDLLEKFVTDKESSVGLGYNFESVDFLKKFGNFVKYKTEEITTILKTFNLPFSEFSEDEIKKLYNLVQYTYSKEEAQSIIEAGKIKTGKNKGKVSFDNIEKYLNILLNTNREFNTQFVKEISSQLALEENDRALTLIKNMLNFSIDAKSCIYEKKQLNKAVIRTIAKTLTESDENNTPKHKCNEEILTKLENILSQNNENKNIEDIEKELLSAVLSWDNTDNKEKRIIFDASELCNYTFLNVSGENIKKFSNFILDEYNNSIDSIIIEPNQNIKSRTEIITGNIRNPKNILYDLKNGEPVSEQTEFYDGTELHEIHTDFINNTVTDQCFEYNKLNGINYKCLKSQTLKVYDKNKNLISTEIVEKSPIENVFNITKIYPDGRKEIISKAEKSPNGYEIIEKNMTSLDGTKSYYRYEDDPEGNRILDYKIVDENGKTILNQSITFEVIDENHFVSARNGKSFDIKINGNKLIVTNEQTLQKAEFDIEKFTQYTQDKLLTILKNLPGEELFSMKELNLNSLSVNNKAENAKYNSHNRTIQSSEDFLDLAVILHEWGHGKDYLMFDQISENIHDDAELRNIYNKERDAFRANTSEATMSLISYFTSDHHYLGDNAISEGIAETNTILNISPKNSTQSIRAHYWQQYFPKTIAYLASLLN